METTIFDKEKYEEDELARMINEMAFGRKKRRKKTTIKKVKNVPKGFRLVKNSTTAPVGYRLYTDRKGSRFTPRQANYVLVKKIKNMKGRKK